MKYESKPFNRLPKMKKEKYLRLLKIFSIMCKAYPLAISADYLVRQIHGQPSTLKDHYNKLRSIKADLRTLETYHPAELSRVKLIVVSKPYYVTQVTRAAVTGAKI